MKNPLERTVTLHFIDGTKLSLEFPHQGGGAAARKLKIGDFLSGQHLVVEADGSVLVCPIANIKYMSFASQLLDTKDLTEVLPPYAILGASVRF